MEALYAVFYRLGCVLLPVLPGASLHVPVSLHYSAHDLVSWRLCLHGHVLDSICPRVCSGGYLPYGAVWIHSVVSLRVGV